MADLRSEKTDFVESIVSSMVENDLDVRDAVSQVLDDNRLPESVDIDVEDPACQNCGSTELQFGVTEQEDGEEVPTIYCPECDTGYVAEGDESDEEEDMEFEEVAIDPNNPACPTCQSPKLEAQVLEDEEGEVEVLHCTECDSVFFPGDDDEEES